MKQFLIKNIILIVVSLLVLLFLLFIINRPSSVVKTIEDSKHKIDSLESINSTLQWVIFENGKERRKSFSRIKELEDEKKLLTTSLNKKKKELKDIKIKNGKIPDDSVFIVLKRKYNEDSITNFN